MIPRWDEESSMKASKFTEAQIAFVLRQAQDGTAVAEICRKAGISDATFYNWRKKYAGLMPSEMRRLRSSRKRTPS
jgi:putative transposase